MSQRRLAERAVHLEAEGADPLRLKVLAAARKFKRSWIEMARVLVKVRASRAYESWGYADLYAYCAEELLIKARTVDKLTGSYVTLEKHAPDLLDANVDRPVPSYDAVDYFARLVGDHADDADASSDEVIADLRQAVFDDAKPVNLLRRQFNPILCPRSDEDVAREALERASSAARRLLSILSGVRGLPKRRVNEVTAALEALDRDLALLMSRASD
jgi:hypothetical protein